MNTTPRHTALPEREGVIKYHLDFRPGVLSNGIVPDSLIAWRDILFRLGLTGMDAGRYGGLAYGNVSVRLSNDHQFIISGTQTGGLSTLGLEHFSCVLSFDLSANHLAAQGPIPPSSEALTHAVVYAERPDAACVLHAHSPEIWRMANRLNIPITHPTARYGTPEMAEEVRTLLSDPQSTLIAMGGHEDGLIAFGANPEQTALKLIEALAQALLIRHKTAPILNTHTHLRTSMDTPKSVHI